MIFSLDASRINICLHIMKVRCKHCCKPLFKGDFILFNAHHEVKQHSTDTGCHQADESDCCSYMSAENIPSWILNLIDQVYFSIKIYKTCVCVYICRK